MSEIIFTSKYWLKLKNESMEKSYHESRSKSHNYWINLLSILALIASVVNTIYQVYLIEDKIDPNLYPFPEILYTSYSITAVNTLLNIFIVSCRNSKIKKILYYFQYFLMGVAFFHMNFSISFYGIDPNGRYNLYGLESLIRIINNIFLFEFIDCLLMTMGNRLCYFTLFLIFQRGHMNGFFPPYLLFNISFVILSYCTVYLWKSLFYFSEKIKKERDLFKNIIDEMNFGFISVKEDKICLINRVMWKIIARNANIMKIINGSQEIGNSNSFENDEIICKKFLDHQDYSRQILNEFFKDFYKESESKEPNEIRLLNKDSFIPLGDNSNQFIENSTSGNFLNIPHCDRTKVLFLEVLKKNSRSNENKFTQLGTKTFRLENNFEEESLMLDLYCRYKFNQETKQDEFEIIFEDVTKAKNIQEDKSQIKCKSIFLSKVAHEFKNPLICINELVYQLSEKFQQLKVGENQLITDCEDNLSQINSFSNYLMVLIKDLNYFTQNDTQTKIISIEKIDCDLKEILKFSNDIALSLIKRNGKDKNISFQIDVSDDAPKIMKTDESRLKQVLVNLLSNSIKFTNHGTITLKVHQEQSYLFFCVSDTGLGIEEKNKKNLFAPFNSFTRSSTVNAHGSGLGMSIIHDLTCALGKQIEFRSELNKGSDFFFSIPIETKIKNKESSKSLNSLDSKFFEIREFSKISRPSLIMENEKFSAPFNYSIIKQNNLFSEKDDKSVINSPLHAFNDEKKKSKFQNTRTKFTTNFPEAPSKYNHNFDFDGNSINCEDLLDIEDKNRTSNKHILFLDTKSISNISSSSPKYINKIRELESARDENVKINLKEQKNQNSFLGTNYENKSFNNLENVSMRIKNEEFSKKNILDKFNFITSRSLNKNNELLSDFIDQFQHLKSLKEVGYLNILLVDDERLARSSTKRIISKFAKNNNYKLNFIEAEDGLECLYIIYICTLRGIKISCVISDQTMNYLDGSDTAIVIRELTNCEAKKIPFYIVSAHEDESILKKIKSAPITNIFSKPLDALFIAEIFENLNK